MKLYINEKLFSMHDKFFAFDEQGNNVYEISSEIFTIGKKTSVFDMQGNQVAYIEQEILHWMPTYNIYADGEFLCQIKRKLGLFTQNYDLSNGFRVEGSCFPLDVNLYNAKNEIIGTIKKSVISLGDKYEIEIFDESYLKIVLGIAVSIANDVNRRQSNSSRH